MSEKVNYNKPDTYWEEVLKITKEYSPILHTRYSKAYEALNKRNGNAGECVVSSAAFTHNNISSSIEEVEQFNLKKAIKAARMVAKDNRQELEKPYLFDSRHPLTSDRWQEIIKNAKAVWVEIPITILDYRGHMIGVLPTGENNKVYVWDTSGSIKPVIPINSDEMLAGIKKLTGDGWQTGSIYIIKFK